MPFFLYTARRSTVSPELIAVCASTQKYERVASPTCWYPITLTTANRGTTATASIYSAILGQAHVHVHLSHTPSALFRHALDPVRGVGHYVSPDDNRPVHDKSLGRLNQVLQWKTQPGHMGMSRTALITKLLPLYCTWYTTVDIIPNYYYYIIVHYMPCSMAPPAWLFCHTLK